MCATCGASVVAVVVAVEALAPKAYPRVALASASALSVSVIRALRVGEGGGGTSKDVLSRRIMPGASPQPVFDCLGLLFTKGVQ